MTAQRGPAGSASWRAALPGLVLALVVAAAARALHASLPEPAGRVLGEVIFAVALGLAAGNSLRLPPAFAPGIRYAVRRVLPFAIVLLGAAFSFFDAVRIGARALLIVVVLIALALVVARSLGRAARVPPRLATLIGVGTAVCGNSAISATAPVIRATDDEVAFAIATNTLFGTLAVLAYPLLGRALGMDDASFGTWAGTAVNDTSQVVAAGFAYGPLAGGIATVVKLTRNALMGAVIVVAGLLHPPEEGARRLGLGARVAQSVPPFVLGFLALAAARTVGVLDALSALLGSDVAAALQQAAKVLILIALAGVGLGTRFVELGRIGWKPLAVGLATACTTALASWLLIQALGPATS